MLLARGWMRTLDTRIDPESLALIERRHGKPSVYVFWHNRLFTVPELYRRFHRPLPMGGLISASRDGAWLAACYASFGIIPVRGSANFRGPVAIREALRHLRAGKSLAVTPDGSRGPVYEMKPGAAMIALHAPCKVIAVQIAVERAWRLKSWDRFYLPKPFSQVRVAATMVHAAIDESPAEYTDRIEREMRELNVYLGLEGDE